MYTYFFQVWITIEWLATPESSFIDILLLYIQFFYNSTFKSKNSKSGAVITTVVKIKLILILFEYECQNNLLQSILKGQ